MRLSLNTHRFPRPETCRKTPGKTVPSVVPRCPYWCPSVFLVLSQFSPFFTPDSQRQGFEPWVPVRVLKTGALRAGMGLSVGQRRVARIEVASAEILLTVVRRDAYTLTHGHQSSPRHPTVCAAAHVNWPVPFGRGCPARCDDPVRSDGSCKPEAQP